MKLHGDFSEKTCDLDGVSVKTGTLHLIFYDLKMLQNSPGYSV
jgi:hypothetical protein